MSTSANLPAGFSITSINGQRCTAVPKASTTLTGADASAAAAFNAISTSTTTSDSSVSSSVGGGDSASAAATSVAGAPATTLASSTVVTSSTSLELISSSSSAAAPASKGTTPTTSSTTPAAVAQSDIHTSSTAAPGNNAGIGFQAPGNTLGSLSAASSPTASPAQASTSSGISPNQKATVVPIVGGVVGTMAIVGLLALILWAIKRRRKIGRESLLTPLTTSRRSQYYEGDNANPTERMGRGKNQVRGIIAGIGSGLASIGASLKAKVAGDRSDTPSVNLNRGNSQFLDGPIPQHSRNNSVLSQNAGHTSVKELVAEWWESVGDGLGRFTSRLRKKSSEPADPFAAARGMTEKQAKLANPPDFSQLLGMGDRDLQLQTERRRLSLQGKTDSLPQIDSLGLNFSDMDNPFSDPVARSTNGGWRGPTAKADPFADPPARSNPFADPPTRPGATIPKGNTYISDIRRSRGQSIDTTTAGNNTTSNYRPPSTAAGSIYPSSIAPSRDSYRDTIVSSFSANARKGKGRSDPFDLERPELWQARNNDNGGVMYPAALNTMNPLRMSRPGNMYSNQQSRQNLNNRIQSTATYASKYSSGVSSLGDWGEPGPDLGPGSGGSSMRGNASSNGSGDFTADRGLPKAKEWDARRQQDNVSPASKASSKGGVGKAM